MSNKEKMVWCGCALLLLLLFLMSSTDLIIKEKEIPVYPVSVIIDDASDEYYINLKKGMDMAAEEFHADVNFITLYNDNSETQQTELVERELKDGAKALVICPVKEKEAVEALEEKKPGCPVIFLGEPSDSDVVTDSFYINGQGMGKLLAEKAAENLKPGMQVYLFSEGLAYGQGQAVYDGVTEILSQKNIVFHLFEKEEKESWPKVLESSVHQKKGKISIIALDTPSLEKIAKTLEEKTVYRDQVAHLYGPGSTSSILNEMDRGIIDGIVTYNQFDEGYLSIKRAIEAIQGDRKKKNTSFAAVYLERKNLREKQYEKMLCPIG